LPTSTIRRPLPLIVLGVSLAAAIAVQVRPGYAAPQRPESLERQLEENNHKAEQKNEEVLEAKAEKAGIDRQIVALTSAIRRANLEIAALQMQANQIGVNRYKQGPGQEITAVLEARDPAKALQGIQVVSVMSLRDRNVLADLRAKKDANAGRMAEFTQVQRKQAAVLARLQRDQAELERTGDRIEGMLRRLRAEERARRVTRTAQQNYGPKPEPPAPASPASVPAGSGGAGAAVAYALAQVGKPYCWGGSGPGCFDCSGLTMMAWRQGGISLPHSSGGQLSIGTLVPRGSAQPGDLVGYPGHVGLYIGNGRKVAATHTGDYVRNQPLGSSDGVYRLSG
jgi:cell wall-associated NlpC family hydrolase